MFVICRPNFFLGQNYFCLLTYLNPLFRTNVEQIGRTWVSRNRTFHGFDTKPFEYFWFSGIATRINATIEMDALIGEATGIWSPVRGGGAAPLLLPMTRSQILPKSLPLRRKRRRLIRSWPGPGVLTFPLPSCAWCSNKSLTRAGETEIKTFYLTKGMNPFWNFPF